MKIEERMFLNYRLINYLKGINGGEFTPRLTKPSKIISGQAVITVGGFYCSLLKEIISVAKNKLID